MHLVRSTHRLGYDHPKKRAGRVNASSVSKPKPPLETIIDHLALAYKTLGISEADAAKPEYNLNSSEARAFNVVYKMFGEDKLGGRDGVFDSRDADAIVDGSPWFLKQDLMHRLKHDADLLHIDGAPDTKGRTITAPELLNFDLARQKLEKYVNRIGFKSPGIRFVPNSRSSLVAFVKSLIMGRYPEGVPSRRVVNLNRDRYANIRSTFNGDHYTAMKPSFKSVA